MSVPVQPDWPQPSHPELIEVRYSATEFNTSAHSLVSLPPGALFTPLTSPPLTLTSTKAYSSIQLSRTEHAELHSDLLYVNHSCEPSLVFDMAAREVRVASRRVQGEEQEGKERGLEVGDELTFFYPSSEWSMAQPFECRCGAGEGVCKGWIGGAKEMGRERMKGMWLNAFIEELLDEQEREAAAAAKDVEATAVKDVEVTAKDGDKQPTVKEERSKRTERKGSCNVQ
ncbi:hypothetical protein EXIGLDRAFT_717654 [Exidia glandulosa HHB12029]|uniref:SET domain-containing protein n=1 Tax=Exidia glandulosa HHB12029 TaxID=1314781 RepID=A0A165I7C9_EXIGL|nr:hypothetical protein EXIGLDRAFT_717654 [Exidia glandulosa HHB12029]